MIGQAMSTAAIGTAIPDGGTSIAGAAVTLDVGVLLALSLMLGAVACAWFAYRYRRALPQLLQSRRRSLTRIRRQLECSARVSDYRDQLGQLMAGLNSQEVEDRLLSLIALEWLARVGSLAPREHNRLLCQLISSRRAGTLPQGEPEAPGEDIVLALRQLKLPRRQASDGINLAGCDLRKLVLPRADLSHVVLTGANLECADLSESRLRATCLARAALGGGTFRRSMMAEVDLFEADLRSANLSGCELTRAILGGAQLAGADLATANIANANMRHAGLSRAVLVGANLTGADLTGASLVGADLGGAKLEGACLDGANLTGAMLSNATGLKQAQLDGAYGDHDTALPPPLTLKLVRRPAAVAPIAA